MKLIEPFWVKKEETTDEVGKQRGEQPHVTQVVMQNTPVNVAIPPASWAQWWIEAAARRKAEAKRKAEEEEKREAGAEAMYGSKYEAMLRATEEAKCKAEAEAEAMEYEAMLKAEEEEAIMRLRQ